MVTDQIGSPTWARHLAETTAMLVAKADNSRSFLGWLENRKGLYHLAGKGSASRFEWAKAVLEYIQNDKTIMARELLPAQTSEFPSPATRPLFTALNCDLFQSTFDLNLPPWKESLRQALDLASS